MVNKMPKKKITKKIVKKAVKEPVKKPIKENTDFKSTVIKELFKKKKEEYDEGFKHISEQDIRKFVSMFALKDVVNDTILKLLLKKKIITKKEFNEELIRELKSK